MVLDQIIQSVYRKCTKFVRNVTRSDMSFGQKLEIWSQQNLKMVTALADYRTRVRTKPARNSNPNTADYFSDGNFPFVADPDLGVWNRPSHHFVKTTLRTDDEPLVTEVWFDRYGARVSGAGAETPPQVDLLVVGESNTWGQGLAYEDTYAARLGRALQMSVGNVALINSNGVQNLLTIKKFLSRRPRLIVFALWEEHFWSNVVRCPNIDSPVCLQRPVVTRGWSGRLRIRLPSRADRVLRDYRRWYMETAPDAAESIRRDHYWTARVMLQEVLNDYPRFRRDGAPWPELVRTKRWLHCLAAAKFVNEEMQKLADTVGAQLVVVYMPFFFRDVVVSPPQDIIDHAKDRGITFISMDETWRRRKDDNTPFYFAEDLHLDTTGHGDIAEQVLAVLER